MYKTLKFGSQVEQLKDFFNLEQRNLDRERRSNNCVVIAHKTVMFEKSLQYFSVKTWNSLPNEIKDFNTSNLNIRKALNEWIMSNRSVEFVSYYIDLL